MIKRLLPLALILAADTPAAAVPAYTPALEARIFDRAWRLVEERYWNRALTGPAWVDARDRFRPRAIAAPDRQSFYTILGEMLAGLGDSHVYAIDPVQRRIERTRDKGGAAQGFGFDMLPDDDGVWRVTDVRAGGPAASAGVQIGWVVEAVNNKPVDIDYQPQPNETAAFAFVDEKGKSHPIRLLATLEMPVPSRRATLLPGGALLLALDGFDPGDDAWLRDRIGEAKPAGLVLDLRNNPGGDADVAARVAGLFFPANRPFVVRIGAHRSEQRTQGAGPRCFTGPLVVLIGPDSASAAEALAALIDEAGRGVTVGARTAGALTGAADFDLPDGGQLSVAEFDLRTPAGRRLEGTGLAPKIAVEQTLADRRAGRDPALQRAKALLAAAGREAPARDGAAR